MSLGKLDEIRPLTEDEIESITSGIPEVKVRKYLEEQLKKVKIKSRLARRLKLDIMNQYHRSKVQPGEAVGIIAAQNIGEGMTQKTLNTFHSSGISIKTVVAGVPRFSELIGSTKNPKFVMCTVFPLIPTTNIDEVRNIGRQLGELRFKNLIECFKPDVKPKKWYDLFDKLYPEKLPDLDSSTILRFKLNKKILYENRLDLEDIAKKIEFYVHDYGYLADESEWMRCVWSPVNFATLDVVTNIKIPLNVYENILLYGIAGIKDVEYKRTKPSDPWYIEAEGSDIQSILKLENIDKTTVICNDMWKIYECFGIEATRQFLIEEFTNIISSDGTFIHEGNIKVLVDMMTHTGTITSISRYSVKKSETGVLGKASFEESFSNMIEGAQRGQSDPVTSVSSSVIVGRGVSIGTGLPTLLQKF